MVLYQQWVGDIEDSFDVYAYLQEAQAVREPEPKGVTLIEITSSQSFEASKLQVDAARRKMETMFPE